jgi:hypothetical protein
VKRSQCLVGQRWLCRIPWEKEPFPGGIHDLANRREVYDQFWKDLYVYGLVNTDGLHAMTSASGARVSRTTDLGKQFLRFIGQPKP